MSLYTNTLIIDTDGMETRVFCHAEGWGAAADGHSAQYRWRRTRANYAARRRGRSNVLVGVTRSPLPTCAGRNPATHSRIFSWTAATSRTSQRIGSEIFDTQVVGSNSTWLGLICCLSDGKQRPRKPAETEVMSSRRCGYKLTCQRGRFSR